METEIQEKEYLKAMRDEQNRRDKGRGGEEERGEAGATVDRDDQCMIYAYVEISVNPFTIHD